MPRYSTADINLVPQSAPQMASIGQRLFRLAIKQGKAIIIITEAIVLLVFFSRFKLDRQISDLIENIENKYTIIQSSTNLESEYKQLQQKTQTYKGILDTQIDWPKRLADLNSKIPEGTTLEMLDYKPASMDIQANVKTAQAFGTFISILSNDKSIDSIILKTSEYDTEYGRYNFNLAIKLNAPGRETQDEGSIQITTR